MQQDFDPRDLEPTLPSEEPKGRRWLPATIALVALGGFSGIVWYAYNQGASQSNGGAVPLVQADAGPLKTRPTDPGGMDVPNQDKLILNGQAVDVAGGKVERLLPPPEAPMAKPVAPQPQAAQIAAAAPPALNAARPAPPAPAQQQASPILVPSPAPQVAAAAPRATVQTAPQPQPVVARPATPPPAPAAQAPAPVAAKPPAPVAAPPATAPTPAAAASAGRGGKVQLGAVKSEAAATAEWAKLQKTHPELAALSISVAKVEIPNKGTYYRIQAGPAADAAAVCGAVKARGQDCLVVR